MTLCIKICCIASKTEAELAIEFGAHALGLVSAMPSGPGIIEESLIAEIAASVPPSIATFLLTCRQDAESIIDQQRRCRTNTIQLCDSVSADCCHQLRRDLPGIKLVRVVHVCGAEAIKESILASTHVDALLLDSGNQKLAVKELGGTGRTHDWSISRAIRESVPIPVFLAGGLNPGNIGSAMHEVSPFGVDVCSGVRTDGRLDPVKLSQFIKNASMAS